MIMATSPIKHIVVLMLENRSYDNVLGGLYLNGNTPPSGQSDLSGLTGDEWNVDPAATLKNPLPNITIQPAQNTTVPAVDPGEPFADMAQQIWGLPVTPIDGANPIAPGALGVMGGFTTNYAAQLGSPPAQDVMTYLTPDQVPVTAFLAKNFAVSDQWYGSVPTQTFPNRMFVHCGAPGAVDGASYLNDSDYVTTQNPLAIGSVTLPSVFSQLDAVYGTDGPPNWKVYFHDFPNALLINYVVMQGLSSTNANIATIDNADWGDATPWFLGAATSTFLDDVTNNALPKYSFIEPRYLTDFAPAGLPPNSNHPGAGYVKLPSNPQATDVTNGEILLATVYNALYNSDSWDSTLLIVTYDEHGGLYDHVSPPQNAAAPGASTPPAFINGFEYKHFGPRVPAIFISPWVASGSVFRPNKIPFDHTTIIKTLWDCFGLGTPSQPSLTDRDATAESVLGVASLQSASNNPGEVTVPSAPQGTAPPVPGLSEAEILAAYRQRLQ
jgi:phospholipase C